MPGVPPKGDIFPTVLVSGENLTVWLMIFQKRLKKLLLQDFLMGLLKVVRIRALVWKPFYTISKADNKSQVLLLWVVIFATGKSKMIFRPKKLMLHLVI